MRRARFEDIGMVGEQNQIRLWKFRRLAADLRQLDMCLATGISQTRYSMIERGIARPTNLECRAIAKHLPTLFPELVEGVLDAFKKSTMGQGELLRFEEKG